MNRRKRSAIVAGITTVAAAAAAAIALAVAGPGTPEAHNYGGGFDAFAVDGAARFCTGTDGDYFEFRLHYRAEADETRSSDPRFDGRVELYLHTLVRDNGSDITGHVDGTSAGSTRTATSGSGSRGSPAP